MLNEGTSCLRFHFLGQFCFVMWLYSLLDYRQLLSGFSQFSWILLLLIWFSKKYWCLTLPCVGYINDWPSYLLREAVIKKKKKKFGIFERGGGRPHFQTFLILSNSSRKSIKKYHYIGGGGHFGKFESISYIVWLFARGK